MEKKYKSKSKIRKITCRVETCKLILNEQSYKDHLETVHPREDSKDRREYGMPKLSTFFKTVSANKKMRTRGPGDSSASGHVMSELEEQEVDMDLDDQLNEVPAREERYKEGFGDEGNVYTDMEKGSRGVAERFEEECVGESTEENTDDEKEMESNSDASVDLLPSLGKEIEDLALRIGDVDVTECKDDIEVAQKRLNAAKKYVDVGKDIRQLDNVVQSLKDSLGVKEEKDVPKENVDTNAILKNARTMKEIVDKVYQFEYEQSKAGGMVICRVCEASFKYSNNLSLDFTSDKIIGREFSNLKGALKKHLVSPAASLGRRGSWWWWTCLTLQGRSVL